jgi:hypothetical protein
MTPTLTKAQRTILKAMLGAPGHEAEFVTGGRQGARVVSTCPAVIHITEGSDIHLEARGLIVFVRAGGKGKVWRLTGDGVVRAKRIRSAISSSSLPDGRPEAQCKSEGEG